MVDYNIYGECPSGLFIGLNGKPVHNTPFSAPYSYDEFLLYKAEDFSKKDTCVYSDRLYQWNPTVFKGAYAETWPLSPYGQTFSGKSAVDIERFLCMYLQRAVHLTVVLQGCNVGNGYPYWVFFFRDIDRGV